MYQTFISFSESHVIRAVYGYSYETIEITGPQMVLTMKLTTFAWNVYDGRRKVEVCLPTFPS
jgi:lysophospholipid acyltransferase